MSDKTKAMLQAELKAAKEEIKDLKEKIAMREDHCEKYISDNKNLSLEIQDLHEGIKLLQQKLESANGLAALRKAEVDNETKAKLLAIEEMEEWKETARIYGIEIDSLKGEVEDWQTYYREKTVLDCIREWFNFKKEALCF